MASSLVIHVHIRTGPQKPGLRTNLFLCLPDPGCTSFREHSVGFLKELTFSPQGTSQKSDWNVKIVTFQKGKTRSLYRNRQKSAVRGRRWVCGMCFPPLKFLAPTRSSEGAVILVNDLGRQEVWAFTSARWGHHVVFHRVGEMRTSCGLHPHCGGSGGLVKRDLSLNGDWSHFYGRWTLP